MKTTYSLTRANARPPWAWIALLLVAIVAAASDSRGAPPEPKPESEERFGKRVLNFFKRIGDRDEKERNTDNRPRVSLDKPPGQEGTPPDSIASRVRAGENPVVPSPTSLPPNPASPAPPVAKKKVPRPSVQTGVRETEPAVTSTETRNEAPSSENLDATKKQLADLKRQVADMEAQLAAKSQGGKEPVKTSSTPGEYEIPLTAPTSPLPPRGVAPGAADTPPKKSFATESPISSTTAPGPSTAAPPTGANAKMPPANNKVPDAPPPADAAGTPSDIPIAAKTEKPGIVKSPHPPYNEVDVIGLQKGTLAKDPTTQKVFRVP